MNDKEKRSRTPNVLLPFFYDIEGKFSYSICVLVRCTPRFELLGGVPSFWFIIL